ncbi:hypothetical protein T492DRAFT_898505, partial [Pavlovales sp. CCMP2436]
MADDSRGEEELRTAQIAAYTLKLKQAWAEHDEIVQMLMALRFAGQAKEEQELLGQLANVKAVVELNARLLGTEEVKLLSGVGLVLLSLFPAAVASVTYVAEPTVQLSRSRQPACSTTAEKYKKDTGAYKPEDAALMACRVRRLEEHAKARPRDRGPEYEAFNETRRAEGQAGAYAARNSMRHTATAARAEAVNKKLVAFLVEEARQGDEAHAVLAAAAAGNGYPPPYRRRLGP